MKMTKNIGLIVLIILSLSSCSRRFSNATYNKESIQGKRIAVLPYRVVTTGRIPEGITEDMIIEIEAAESQAFQVSLYNQILDRLDRRRHRNLNLRVQSIETTNQKLEAAGIRLEESWKVSSEDLADILGVDAIARSTVHKTQYLTELESYGIFVAREILANLSSSAYWLMPRNRTSDVRISTSIIDVKNGNTIWTASRICPTDWRNNTYDVIERINHRITRRLPR